MLVLANKRICVLRSAASSQGTTLLADVHTRGCFKANKLTNGTLTQSFERTVVIVLFCTRDSSQTTSCFVSWYCYSFVCDNGKMLVGTHGNRKPLTQVYIFVHVIHHLPGLCLVRISVYVTELTHLMHYLHRGEEFWCISPLWPQGDSSPLSVFQMSYYKTQYCTTHIHIFHDLSLVFVNKLSSDLFIYQEPSSENVSLRMRMRSHKVTISVIKINDSTKFSEINAYNIDKIMVYRKV